MKLGTAGNDQILTKETKTQPTENTPNLVETFQETTEKTASFLLIVFTRL